MRYSLGYFVISGISSALEPISDFVELEDINEEAQDDKEEETPIKEKEKERRKEEEKEKEKKLKNEKTKRESC